MKIIISTLGNSKGYNPSKVFFENRLIGESRYHPLLFAKILGADLRIITLDNETTRNSAKDLCLNDVVYLKEEEFFDRVLKELKDAVENYDEVYVDFTHSQRDVSFIFLLATLTFSLSVNKNIRFLYGFYDSEKGETRIKSVNSYFNHGKDFLGLVSSTKDLDFHHLLEKLDSFKKKKEELKNEKTQRIKSLEGLEKNKVIEEYNNKILVLKEEIAVLNELININLNLNFGNVHRSFMDEIKCFVKTESKSPLTYMLKENLKEILEEIDSKYVYERQFNLGKFFYKKGKLLIALSLWREAFVSKVVEEGFNGDPYDKNLRREAENKIKGLDVLEKDVSDHPKFKNPTIDKLFRLRNAVDHPLTTYSLYKIANDVIGSENQYKVELDYKKLNKFVEELEDLIKGELSRGIV